MRSEGRISGPSAGPRPWEPYQPPPPLAPPHVVVVDDDGEESGELELTEVVHGLQVEAQQAEMKQLRVKLLALAKHTKGVEDERQQAQEAADAALLEAGRLKREKKALVKELRRLKATPHAASAVCLRFDTRGVAR